MHLFVASKLSNFLRSQPHFATASLGYSAAPGHGDCPMRALLGGRKRMATRPM
jgi:hypothetical protein